MAQAFALQGARSILTVEATRQAGTKAHPTSAGATATRPFRGICAISSSPDMASRISGKSDAEVIAAMLQVRIRAFRPSSRGRPRKPASCRRILKIPSAYRENLPERIAGALKPAREAGLLPSFPFGSDFTDTEQRLIPALQLLQKAQRAPQRLAELLWQGLTRRPDEADAECLARLGLDRPATWSERAYRALVGAALVRSLGAQVDPACDRRIVPRQCAEG